MIQKTEHVDLLTCTVDDFSLLPSAHPATPPSSPVRYGPPLPLILELKLIQTLHNQMIQFRQSNLLKVFIQDPTSLTLSSWTSV